MKMREILRMASFLLMFPVMALANKSVTMVLLGNQSDAYSIRIARDFSIKTNNVRFNVCDSNNECRSLGERTVYDSCQIKELVKTPWWAILFDGGSAYAKSSPSWAGFAKALVGSDNYEFVMEEVQISSPTRVTDLLSEKPARETSVLNEARKIEAALAKVDNFVCK